MARQKRRAWAPEEEERLWQMFERDVSLKAIATILGRSYDSVEGRLLIVRKRKREEKNARRRASEGETIRNELT